MRSWDIPVKLVVAARQKNKERQYWLDRLSGELIKSTFPYDYKDDNKNETQKKQWDTFKWTFDSDLYRGLIKLSTGQDVKLHIILTAVLTVLLEKYTPNNHSDIILGTPIYKQQDRREFINTVLPLRNPVNPALSFKELLLRTRQTMVEAVKHQSYPLEVMVNELDMNPYAADFPLFDVIILFENIQDKKDIGHIPVNLLFSFSREETNEAITAALEYNSSLFKKATIERITNHFTQLLRQIMAQIDIPVGSVDILSEEDKKQLLIDFNHTEALYPEDKTVHELFEEQVEKTPDRMALIGTKLQNTNYKLQTNHKLQITNYKQNYNISIIYRELNEKANQLARDLRKQGVTANTITAVILEPCIEMITGIMAILKAGGAYLPIDPQYPRERIISILTQSDISLLLTCSGILQKYSFNKINVITLDHIWANTGSNAEESEGNLQSTSGPGDLLYLISTSGSTGKPKNVMLEHRNLINLLHFQFTNTGIEFNKVLQFASIGFDVAAQEIFSTLLSGGELFLLIPCETLFFRQTSEMTSPKERHPADREWVGGATPFLIAKEMKSDVPRLFDYISQEKIEVLFLPPAFLRFVFSDPRYIAEFPRSVRHIIAAGEQLIVSEAFKNYLQENKVVLHNHYGPSETHVVTTLTLKPGDHILQRPSIGYPISNTCIYILDEAYNPKPLGAVGELYINGANVGRGYLNNPELTVKRFCLRRPGGALFEKTAPPGPPRKNFSLLKLKGTGKKYINQKLLWGVQGGGFLEKSPPGRRRQKLYRTGDLARWLYNGSIEFTSRVDYQVKIRGFRIEPGEVESALLQSKTVKEAVVIDGCDDKGDKYLCAYVVSPETLEPSHLRELLSGSLPDYMIPAYFVQVDRIPLTPNGKIHRKALPKPELHTGLKYVAPKGELENRLAALWSEVLTINQGEISADANFFDLGGHSLKATVLISRIHKELDIKITLGDVFEHPTIKELAQAINKSKKIGYTSIQPVEKKEYYNLSSAQQRLYIIYQMAPENLTYNMPAVTAPQGDIDREKLEKTFKKLVHRHESLRTSFRMVNNRPVQQVHDKVEFEIQYLATEDTEYKNYKLQNTRPLSIKKAGAETNTNSKFQIPNKKETKGHHSSFIIHHSFFIRPFDLSQAPLLRVGILEPPHTPAALRGHPSQEGKELKHLLMVDMHHIITDGMSMEIFINEFKALYTGETLPTLKVQYKDFSQWQDSEKEKEVIKKHEAYWLTRFEDEVPVLELPVDYPRPVVRSDQGSSISFEISAEETKALNDCAREQGATLHMILLSVFNIFLAKICSVEDIDMVVGTPAAGRRHADLEQVIGMFVNMLAIRTFPASQKTFTRFLKEVKQQTLKAFENQDYPFEDLVEKVVKNRDTGRNPLFDTALALHDIDIETQTDNLMQHNNTYEIEHNIAKFDLSLHVQDKENLSCTFEYGTTLFKRETIVRFVSYFKTAVSVVTAEPGIKISQIEIIPPGEKHRLLYDFNNTGADYPKEKSIHQLFAEQVERTPDNIAVIGKMQSAERKAQSIGRNKERHAPCAMRGALTYKELNEKSNRLAGYLKRKGIKPGTIAAMLVDRSIDMIVGIIAILKAGGAYLPIDPDYPGERLSYILEDSQTPVLLTDSNTIKKISFTGLQGLQVIKTQPRLTGQRPQIMDFDSLPFPHRSLVNYEKYNRYIGQAMVKNSISLQGTRGCPYNCAYCHKIWPKKHAVRSAGNIFQEVRLYYRMGIRRFLFVDDIFNFNKANSTRFFQLIIENGLKVQLFFPNGLRGDILSKEYIDLMVKAGTVNLALALETASPRLQKLVGKNLNLDKLRENLEYLCRKYPHVILELFTMHGFPTESPEEAMMTLDFIKNLKWIHFPYVHILKIYPNTGMEKLALDRGVRKESIFKSAGLSYHQLPTTLPFPKAFTLKYQADFLNNYFLSKERLLHVLPFQAKVLTKDELLMKYDSYLPVDIKCFEDLLSFTGIREDELKKMEFLPGTYFSVPGLNEKLSRRFPVKKPTKKALKVLLLDLSQFFSAESNMLYDVVEPPLGLMNILTYLQQQLGNRINGKIAKSKLDFDNYTELKALLEEFKPGIIGIRTLSFYKGFFHRTISMIRHWGYRIPVITGGPYATSDYASILQDTNVDLVVLGEGEVTFTRLIEKIIDNNGELPGKQILDEIPGIAYLPQKSQACREIVLLDTLEEVWRGEPVVNRGHINLPTLPAYVIYTSGTTGNPKGVVIEHKNVVRLLFNDKFQFDFNDGDVWAMFHSYCFDFSVWEMYGALLYGGKLAIISRMAARDTNTFLEVLIRQRVTVLNQTPSAFYGLIDRELAKPAKHLNLKYIIFGGEALNPGKLNLWKSRYPETKLINMYGITETTVHVTYKEIGNPEIAAGTGNIGTPIPTLTVYIMDRYLKLQPLGTAGEICVGGAGVGKGYLNRPRLTKEKFVYNPYKSGERLYRSGDLARLSTNGEMEYLGRIDHQVKVRGFRIEPAEIENRLRAHQQIKDAVVLPGEEKNGAKYLCAYIVIEPPGTDTAAPENGPDFPELREYLSLTLPDYMIPAYFVMLAKIPLTANGKLDRVALPAPRINTGEAYVAPNTEIEKKLAAIWAKSLGPGGETIGSTDNFFNLGGDSIKAISLISSINEQLKTNLKLVNLYTHGTIRELAALILQESSLEANDRYDEVAKEIQELGNRIKARMKQEKNMNPDIQDAFPMSDIQKGMVFYYLKDMETNVYHDQFIYNIKYKDFDIKRFEQALTLMVKKHEILRTCLNMEDFEEPVQLVLQNINLNMEHVDISGMNTTQQEEFIKKIVDEDRRSPFKINVSPPWRMKVFTRSPENICLLFVCHHAIMDGWSIVSFWVELHNTYQEVKSDPGFAPRKLKSGYKDVIIEELIEKQRKETADYWKKELENYKRVEFPGIREKADGPRNMIVYHYEPEKEILEKLRKCAQTHNTSVKNLCIGAYIYTINMISYESDITVGIVTNNRPVKEDGGKILGCFLNTIPLRMNIPSHISWEDYIRIVENKIQEVKQYERLPLFEIARILGERNKDRNPIFDTIMNFMDFHVLHRAAMGDDWAESKDMILPVEGNFDTNTLFDFEMDITTGRLLLGPKYNPSAISQQLVAKCCLYFERILNKFTNEPTALMSKKTVIPEEEIKKLLYEFNHTAADYSQHKTMHQLFEEQVEKTPDHTSVVGPLLVEYRSSRTYMTYISYTELNKESNRLAHFLRKKGVTPGGLVAVIMERSRDMVTAVMAILKAGGAYVPLEPYLPRRRVQKILDSLEIRWVITDSSNRQDVETMAGSLSQLNHILYPDEPADAEIWENPAPMAVPGDMAYIIFTSGSTGTPKGVVETHRPVVNVIEWVNKTFNITPGDKLLFITSLGFDLSVYDIFGILASGASLRVVPSPDTKDPKRLLDVIMNEGITFWDSAPAALQQLVPFFHEVSGYSIKSRLRLVFLSGDWIPVTLPDVLRQTFTGVQVVSMGGATEATIWSNYYLIGNVHHSWPSIPYGKPMQNARYYILDKNLELSPILVPGDLYISGECLASGYINEVELTSEKFNQKLLRGVQGGGFLEKSPPGRRRQNIYKTGDMARWLADGNMEFLGRKDLQVKVRGFRIELGEIESQLLKHEEIKAGIVTARKDKNGHNYLCAYFCADRDMNNEELKEHLSGELPEYMIPTYFIQLDAVPVTANGKVDRKALPEPGLEMGNLSTAVAPRNEIEKKLAEIWREILGSGSSAPDSFISIDADFFELGGHSLNATVLIAKVHKALDVKIPLAEIFNSPTIRELARYIQKTTGNKYTAIRSVEKKEYYPVSSAQKRMYLLNRVKGKNDISDNTPGIMTAAGSLDLERVETAVRQLLKRHEVFRTSFVMLAEEPVQRVHQEAVPEFAVEYHGTASSEIEVRGITRNFVRPFDLGCAPLLRVGLAKLVEKNQNKYLVMYDMHHIIMDGNSMAIFIKEFLQLYHGLRLPRLRVQYKDFTLWQNNLLQSKSIQKQEEYWSEQFRGEIPVLALPTDFPRPLTQSFVGSRLEFQWDREITGKINRLVRESETTLFVVLLAIYTVLLSRYSDREDIVVGTPVAGRPHADLEDTMGMFVNTLALRNYPNGTKTFSQLLEEVKINSIKAFENQDHQFEHLVERLGLQRDHSRNVLFDTMLVLQNFKMDLSLNQLPIKSGNQEQDSIFSPYSFDEEISRFDITLNAIEHDNVISFIMRYSTRLFKKETMETFIRYFREIANCVVENKEIQLNEIEISHEFSDYSSAILTEAENDFEF